MNKRTDITYEIDDVKKMVRDVLKEAKIPSKTGIQALSQKIDRNQKTLDQIDDVARILQENEQNLKDLGGLKHRLDILDEIFEKVDTIAGEVTTYREQQELNSAKLAHHDDRIEKIEKHLNLLVTS